MREPLKFKIAPHIVQDLGLNLYTDLPRVLVEFVANAFDADSPAADITMDFEAIKAARAKVKAAFDAAQAEAEADKGESIEVEPLSERTLPEDLEIVIADTGHGMSRDDIQMKFLVAGRRRREEEKKNRSPKNRILMGRKGLGKLAGFGVAQRIVILSRKEGEDHATRFVLDYQELIKKRDTEEIVVPDERLEDGGGIEPSGTRIVLSRLVYEPLKSRATTVENAIADHFRLIDEDEFAIRLNEEPVKPPERKLVFAHPKPELPVDDLVEHSYTSDDGREVTFQYRLRFTGEGQSLPARERGVRVYAHKRLAASPDLLDVETGMHGFRNTDYLDGVVRADVIDEQPSEYIATDRQSLRWETPLLAPMREFLSAEMKAACKEYQKVRDAKAQEAAREDEFTKEAIEKARLVGRTRKFAYTVAGRFAALSQGGTAGTEYRTRFAIFLEGLSQGDVLTALSKLALENTPDLASLVRETVELTSREFADAVKYVRGRLDAIAAFKKICKDVDFKKANNEKELHALFKRAPWLIDPTFVQFLISDRSLNTTFDRLARALEIGDYAKTDGHHGDKRADLVFLLGNTGLQRLVIVELKAPNTPLTGEHLRQLENYMIAAREWLRDHDKKSCEVEGYLIGSKASGSRATDVRWLEEQIRKTGNRGDWHVYDILELLERTELAHRQLREIQDRWEAEQGEADEAEEPEGEGREPEGNGRKPKELGSVRRRKAKRKGAVKKRGR